MRRNGHLGKGQEMRITVLGALSLLAAFLLLAYIGQQIERKRNQAKKTDEQARNHDAHGTDETRSF